MPIPPLTSLVCLISHGNVRQNAKVWHLMDHVKYAVFVLYIYIISWLHCALFSFIMCPFFLHYSPWPFLDYITMCLFRDYFITFCLFLHCIVPFSLLHCAYYWLQCTNVAVSWLHLIMRLYFLFYILVLYLHVIFYYRRFFSVMYTHIYLILSQKGKIDSFAS